MAQHDDLCHDAEGDFFGSAAAKVKANGSAHAGQLAGRNALFAQELEDSPDAPLATDHADIGSGRIYNGAQPLNIVRVGAGDKHNVGTRRKGIIPENRFDITYQYLFGTGEALAAGK